MKDGMTILPQRHRGRGEMLHGDLTHIVSGTVEVLFWTHTDAPRGCGKYLYPGRDAGDRIWPSPHIRSEPCSKLSSVFSVPLAKRVVNQNGSGF